MLRICNYGKACIIFNSIILIGKGIIRFEFFSNSVKNCPGQKPGILLLFAIGKKYCLSELRLSGCRSRYLNCSRANNSNLSQWSSVRLCAWSLGWKNFKSYVLVKPVKTESICRNHALNSIFFMNVMRKLQCNYNKRWTSYHIIYTHHIVPTSYKMMY